MVAAEPPALVARTGCAAHRHDHDAALRRRPARAARHARQRPLPAAPRRSRRRGIRRRHRRRPRRQEGERRCCRASCVGRKRRWQRDVDALDDADGPGRPAARDPQEGQARALRRRGGRAGARQEAQEAGGADGGAARRARAPPGRHRHRRVLEGLADDARSRRRGHVHVRTPPCHRAARRRRRRRGGRALLD